MSARKPVTTDDVAPAEKPTAAEGYKVVVSPAGDETTVPDAIVDALLESGYTVK